MVETGLPGLFYVLRLLSPPPFHQHFKRSQSIRNVITGRLRSVFRRNRPDCVFISASELHFSAGTTSFPSAFHVHALRLNPQNSDLDLPALSLYISRRLGSWSNSVFFLTVALTSWQMSQGKKNQNTTVDRRIAAQRYPRPNLQNRDGPMSSQGSL